MAGRKRRRSRGVAHQRRQRQTYEIPAFVFGVRTGQGWTFFSHQLNGAGGMKVVKKAEPLPVAPAGGAAS